MTDIGSPYAPRGTRGLWVGAAAVGAAYGAFLVATALRSPVGSELTGQFALQPAAKALTAVLLAAAALGHRVPRERRWLFAALLFSAAGDFLLAMPWWPPSFILGLGAFLVAHACFLTALVPLARRTATRVAAAIVVCLACVALLAWFWPNLVADGMAIPVVGYMAVLAAMVCAALLARLPTPWTALGAVCFAVSDAMIGIDRFVLQAGAGLPAASGSETLAVPIWWAYATSLLLITAGLFFGRGPTVSQPPVSEPPVSEPSATPPV